MPVPFLRFGTINDLISYLLFSLLSSSLNRGWRGGGRNHTLPTPWATGLLFSSSHCPTRERITTFTAFMVHTTHSLLRRWTQLCLAHSRPWLILPPLCKLASLSWFFRRNFTMVSRGCSLPDPRASSLCPTPWPSCHLNAVCFQVRRVLGRSCRWRCWPSARLCQFSPAVPASPATQRSPSLLAKPPVLCTAGPRGHKPAR